jgi:hypothetical protein
MELDHGKKKRGDGRRHNMGILREALQLRLSLQGLSHQLSFRRKHPTCRGRVGYQQFRSKSSCGLPAKTLLAAEEKARELPSRC